MKHTIGIITLLVMLLMGVTVEAWALSTADIKIDILPAEAKTAGCTVIVNPIGSDGKTVTITTTPSSGYYITKENVVAYLLVSPSSAAPRRAVPISDPLTISGPDGIQMGATEYSFVVPEDYAGAQVTVTFTPKGVATAVVKANDLTYNQTAQELVTATVEGGTVHYQVDATDATGFADAIPKKIDVKRESGTNKVMAYKVYYKIVPDAGFSAPAFDATKDFVEVKINPAKLTKVTLTKTAQKYDAGNNITFDIYKVYASDLEVPSAEYDVTDNVQSTVGSYKAKVTAKENSNYTGYVTANFQIVGDEVVIIDKTVTDAGFDLTKTYVLACDVDASVFANLKSGVFKGTLDGDMYTISGLTEPLFASTNNAVIKNVMLQNVKIKQDGPVGAIVGTASGYTRIYNCGILPTDNKYVAEDEVSYLKSTGGTNSYCGGLVGWLKDDSRVINCFSYANINGGTDVAGIVGHNEEVYKDGGVSYGSTTQVSSDNKYYRLKSAVVNCMFYGNITGGTNRYPVYGGAMMRNDIDNGINNYDFYRAEANLGLADNKHYNCSWPAKEEYLTQYEFYRNLLNSNRELCGWWVGAASAPSGMTTTDVQTVPKDASSMAKWVLDPSIAPYPILKPAGFYPSVVNQAPKPGVANPQRIDSDTKEWVNRATSNNGTMTNPKAAPDSKGQILGSVTVTIQDGDEHDASDIVKTFIITAMDIENHDFCYGKIQLPYYNSIFGNPAVTIDPAATDDQKAAQWNSRYGGNYNDKVVVGWTISATGGIAGITNTKKTENDQENGKVIYDHTYSTNAESGYNFADRYCTTKDENRVFAQGGYYYVPYGVTNITIKAKWATAIYLDNSANHDYDCVRMSQANTGKRFLPAGTRPSTLPNKKEVQTGVINDLIPSGGSVYENAIVLVGNHQYRRGQGPIKRTDGANTDGCTIMSADFDLDEEPDYCLIWQLGINYNREDICPIRFDFLPVVEIGLAMKQNTSTQYYALGCYRPLGHFEVTETSLIHFGQFEFGNKSRPKTAVAPLILNGGIYDQYTKGTEANGASGDYINYIIIGGNVRMPSFTPGAHVKNTANKATRHCPVNVIGGNIDYLYLTGNYNDLVTPNKDNPHCYIDGGNFKQVAAAGKEGIDGNVFFKINHSVINEFYGGSTLADKLVTGHIDVTIDNSYVTKYCGGPKFGNMNLSESTPANNKTITTNALGTSFGVYYGGGNGGTSYVQYDSRDNTVSATNYDWYSTDEKKGGLNGYSAGTYINKTTGYQADYEMEIVNGSTGTKANEAVFRTYFYAAQFSATNTGPITNNLTDCKILTNFYGGGNLGGVKGDVTSTLSGNTHVEGSVFGAGYSASVPEVTIYENDKTPPTVNVYTGIIIPSPESSGTSTTYTWTNKTSLGGNTLSTSSPKAMNVDGVNYFYTEESLENLGTVTGTVRLNIEGTTAIEGDVFGGGESSNASGNIVVNIHNGAIHDVYGGGSKANVGGDTEVHLMGGTINGNVFGGGRGDADHYATVGNTLVKLNEPVVKEGETTYPYNCIVKENIFGCNDINGTPTGNATVHIYKTAGDKPTKKEDLDDPQDSKHKYQLKAVYGGGNLAAYIPDAADATTHVIIDGCDMTSIRQVYGGGNAASTPATKVEVNGTYEIEELFGGGNGKDPIGEGKPNPGANVGYYDYSKRDDNGIVVVDDNGLVQEKNDAMTVAQRQQNYQYGTGEANVKIYGGLVHRVFGGSNTLGNVRKTALTLLDGQEDCEFKVDEAYGGGKSAPMDGAAHLEMACIPGLKAAYGGAEEANILNDVTLNITNGTFDRVFGGNNVQGTISGKITVNIEETGCRPIIIGQLYGGGNQAPYTASDGETGPTLNIRSFTSIGDVFGGGYGKTAVVTGNTTVDINVCEGKFFDKETEKDLGETTIHFTEYERKDNGDFVLDDEGNRVPKTVDIDIYQPPHAAGQIGAINNVFGGGNAARVIGNTNVNIGTKIGEQVNVVSLPIKDSANREPSDPNWEPTYTMKEVKGVNIVGNVYGGGNEAEVTGSTNVTIGKETTTTTTTTPAPPVTPEPAEQATPANP